MLLTLIGGLALLALFRPLGQRVVFDAGTAGCLLVIVLLGTVVAFTCYLTGGRASGRCAQASSPA